MQVRISRHWTLLAAVLFGLLLLIYSRSLWNDFVLWDDDYLIVHNPLIRSLSPHAIWTAFTSYDPELYIPLTFLSYQLNYLIGGLHPFIFHLTNLLLHGINAMLISRIAFKLSQKNVWITAAAGLLFAVHPLHTEAIVWASARKDVLASTFFLVSLFLYLRYRESDQRSTCIWSSSTSDIFPREIQTLPVTGPSGRSYNLQWKITDKSDFLSPDGYPYLRELEMNVIY